ncbi:retinol dehydrogenase 12-like [Cloeon dipterum]|uniref:retinol dehydrogenase 12-like n=1 Tax=Cloeon dipterum TaxID=197152 RepID=UPI00321FF60B
MRVTLISVSVCCAVTALAVSIKRYFGGAKCKCRARLDCKAVVITGATSGIGKALAYEVAKRGAQVILGCRNIDAAWDVANEIAFKTGNEGVYALDLDLTDFKSIREFCKELAECEHEIYALVNNAAVFYHPRELTTDNYDVTFQTNYLGPFYMTMTLLPKMAKNGRIINVSSEAHKFCNDLDLPEEANLLDVYGHSKACLNLFTLELASTQKDVVSVSVNPGNVATNIFRNYPLLTNPIFKFLLWPIRFFVVKTPTQGAQSVLHSILCPQIRNGCYISECREGDPSEFCQRRDYAASLWSRSLKWTNLKEPLLQK